MLKGIEIYRIIHRYYDTQEELDLCYSYYDLSRIEWRGDSNLRQMMNSFRDVEDKLKADVTAGMREEVLLRLFENSRVMENDVHHYKRYKRSLLMKKS